MFQRKATIIFAILGIGTVLGIISGVAPGYFLKGYGLFIIISAFLFFILLLLSSGAVIYEYLNKKSVIFNSIRLHGIFHQGLSRTEKIILSLINSSLFFTGSFFGVIFELLLKAISASVAVHLIIGAIFVAILLIVLIILLIIALKKWNNVKSNSSRSDMLTTIDNEPRNMNSQVVIRPYSPIFNDDFKFTSQKPSISSSEAPSTIRKEYQRLLNPSPRFYVNEKVFVNDHDIAQILGVEGVGIYRIQYLDNGRIDYKPGAVLRKALPFIQ